MEAIENKRSSLPWTAKQSPAIWELLDAVFGHEGAEGCPRQRVLRYLGYTGRVPMGQEGRQEEPSSLVST